MVKVAINGFGRIGRSTLKAMLNRKNITVKAINTLSSPELTLNLLKYDSVHGVFSKKLSTTDNALLIDDEKILLYNSRDPQELPWKKLGIDIVIEATGMFLTIDLAHKHILAGAKKVITTAPLKEGNAPTIVMGVNESILTGKEKIVSNASCTTNCLAPLVKVLDDSFGIENGFLNTVHAYTADQNLHDGTHKDFRRARAATMSIIPTSTGAAKSVGLILPHLKDKLEGLAMRVPVINGSALDLTANIKISTTREEINKLFKEVSLNSMKNIIQYTEDPIVSVDIIGNSHSCVFDSSLTHVNNKLIKIIAWYDNEVGYSTRLVDLAIKIFS